MAATKIINGDYGRDFLNSLRESKMVKITYYKIYDSGDQSEQVDAEMSLPEALLCAVSRQLHNLCKLESKRTFTIEEILGETQSDFEKKMCLEGSNLSDVLDEFFKWLYTGSAHSIGVYYHDLWYFGQKIGAPRFQNDALRELCPRAGGNPTPRLRDRYRVAQLVNCWDFGDFEIDFEYDCSISENIVYYGNKQILKFVLDYFVYLGPEKGRVIEVLQGGGALAAQLAALMASAEPLGENRRPPWDPQNFNQYLVDETILTISEKVDA